MENNVEGAKQEAPKDPHQQAAHDAHSHFNNEVMQEYKIGDKTVQLPGGFQRNEKPEDRKYFPTPDWSKDFVPKDSPEAARGQSPRSPFDQIKGNVRDTIGGVVDTVVNKGVEIVDNLTKDTPWEDFGKDRSLPGIIKDVSRPANRRHQLEEHNLESAYPFDEKTGHVPDYVANKREAEVSRMPDGTGNDLGDPAMGAAGTRFQYNTKPDLRYDINDPPLMDAAQLLDRAEFKALPVMNLLGVASLQGNVHDWMDHGKHQGGHGGEMWTIPVPKDHPISKYHGQTEMKIPKLLVDSTRTTADDQAGIRQTYQNTVTHWWDASEIYGSDAATADRLREHKDGKMRLDDKGLLPIGPEGVPDTGFNQNWSPMLEVIHTLYVREHNSICDMLTKAYPKVEFPKWKEKLPEIVNSMFGDKPPEKLSDQQYDEFIYSRARLINAAEKAKIHTVDWTPVALNNPTMKTAMEGNYGQEKVGWREHVPNHEIGGIWGQKTHQAGIPYAMEEDFVQSYQEMHGLVPDQMKLYDHTTGKEIADIPVGASLQANSRKIIDAAGFDNVLYSLAIDNAGQITTGNHPDFMRDLNIRGNYIDMAAVDILRGREKHLPRYNEYLRQMHEKPIESFEELVPGNPELREQIRKVYNNDIEKVDTVIGTLAEWPHRTPKTMGFSASTFLEFILMASRRVQADRFYTQDFRPEIYTPEGIERIRGLDGLKEIIDRNAPGVQAAIDVRQSAFHPIGQVENGEVKLGGPIPLNNSGIDMEPVNDLQKHLAAFDANKDGELKLGELKNGFEAIGYSKPLAYFKAGMARLKFGKVIADVHPDKGGMYNEDGSLNQEKVDALFAGKEAISEKDVESYLDERGVGFLAKIFIKGQFDSGFKSVGKDSITKDDFIRIMNGDMMKARIAESQAKQHH